MNKKKKIELTKLKCKNIYYTDLKVKQLINFLTFPQ